MNVVIRAELGVFKSALACGHLGDVSVVQAKAKTLRLGLRLVVDLVIKDIEVEVDSLRFVNLLNCLVDPMSHLESLYNDIHNLSLSTNVVSLLFKLRKQNGVVHRLTQFGIYLFSERCWLDSALILFRMYYWSITHEQ